MFKENRFYRSNRWHGMSERPGEPCETSISRIMVTGFETKDIEWAWSTVNKEFIPPSYRNRGKKNQKMVSSRNEKNKYIGRKLEVFTKFKGVHLGIYLQEDICYVLVIHFCGCNALCYNANLWKFSPFPIYYELKYGDYQNSRGEKLKQ